MTTKEQPAQKEPAQLGADEEPNEALKAAAEEYKKWRHAGSGCLPD